MRTLLVVEKGSAPRGFLDLEDELREDIWRVAIACYTLLKASIVCGRRVYEMHVKGKGEYNEVY